MKLQSLLKIY